MKQEQQNVTLQTAGNNITTETANEQTYNPKGIARIFNSFFRFKERGSTMKGEIAAGLSVFFVSLCVLMMNIRIIGETMGGTSGAYAGAYMAAVIVSFIGSLLLGFICNLPLIQVSSLSLSSVFVSTLGLNYGLTYYNILAISFVSSLIFVVLTAVPKVKQLVFKALPAPVRKALPVGVGLYVIYLAFSNLGFFSQSGGTVSFTDFSALEGQLMAIIAIISAVIAIAAIFIFKKLKVKSPYLFGFLIGIISFYALGVLITSSELFTVNRFYIGIGAEDMFTIGYGFENLEFGKIFTSGFDFSDCTGNVFLIFVTAMLTYLFMGMYESESSLQAAALEGSAFDADDERVVNKALMCTAAVNVIAPLFGSAPVSIGKQSAIAAGDGGKTGLTSVVCAIGYFVSMFTWILLMLFATYTAVVPEYGHSGFGFAAYVQAGFAIADAVMLVVGLNMLKGIKNCNCRDIADFLPFVVTVVFTAYMSNVAFGAAAGVISYIFAKLITFKVSEIRSIGIPTAVLGAVMLLLIVFTIVI